MRLFNLRGVCGSPALHLAWFIVAGTMRAAAQPCAYLPPGGPIHYGLVEISRLNVESQVADSPIWLDDGRIAIGAALSSQAGYRRGAVWIMEPFASNLHEIQSYLMPPVHVASAFGAELASSGPWLAATARITNGAYTVCLLQATNATGWAFRTNLVGNPANANDRFGDGRKAIALQDNWLAVVRYELSGRVHLYRVDSQGTWSPREELVIPGFQTTEIHSSVNLALHGRTLAVGVPQNGSSSFAGRVDLWRRDAGDAWVFETSLSASGLAAGDRFGASLALEGEDLFIGATRFGETQTNGGAIFHFRRQDGAWSEATRIVSTNLESPAYLGNALAYSSLGGQYLVDGTRNRIRLFQPNQNGAGWQLVSAGHPGRVFLNWESPPGTIKNYNYDQTNTPVRAISVRAHQVLAELSGISALFEHGWHAIRAYHFSIDPECSTRPVSYFPIGAPRDSTDRRAGDHDGDGVLDIAEVYFGTLQDDSNQLSAGVAAQLSPQRNLVLRWPRVADTNLLVSAQPKWSTNLLDWTADGMVVLKVADEPGTGREMMEATLPATPSSAAYFRLELSTPASP